MGAEGSKLAELARLAENLRDLESELKSKHKTDEADVKKHGWDERDRSPNISIEENNQLVRPCIILQPICQLY